ncbi:zinc finger protein OZF-like [Erpetoichthys calabaricus]|uniref:C2H2-type domain-containing protein n=1 Tax=Erpetoichthys calabaricus TaxID=27687 RepID=A0A8C4T2F9_ERPCA|nr:zinc finger protein OZF-like [Erpetoichthys calabaricus]
MNFLEADLMEQRPASVKEEDCEWDTLYHAQESLSLKLEEVVMNQEECELGSTSFKVEIPERECFELKMQNHEILNVLKQDVFHKNDSSLSPCLAFKDEILLSSLKSSVVNNNSTELDDVILKEMRYKTDEQKQICARKAGKSDLTEKYCGSLAASKYGHISGKLEIQWKKTDEALKTSTISTPVDPESLLCCSLLLVKMPMGDVVSLHQHQQCTPLYVCQVCGKVFNQEFASKSQVVPAGVKPYGCSECGKRFSFKGSLQKHRRIHTGEKPYCCTECGKKFSRSGVLSRHIRIHTGEKPYTCTDCGKRFSDRGHFQRHKKIHTGEKPHCCTECGKRFSRIAHLNTHSRTHTGEKPYSCSECGKRFSQISNLQVHTNSHAGEKPHCCSECGKQFSLVSSLEKHMRLHTGEKPYCCSECGKQFSSKSHLQTHLKFHSGEKPYPCSECGKPFSQISALNRHVRIHTGEKPHSCSQCGKLFSQISDLNRHARIHMKEKLYACSECGELFSTKSHLQEHTKLHTDSPASLYAFCVERTHFEVNICGYD